MWFSSDSRLLNMSRISGENAGAVTAYRRIYAAAKAIRTDWNDGNAFLEMASGRSVHIDDAPFMVVGWVNVL